MCEEEASVYCKACGACGEDGCCSALQCAYKNMVENGCGDYCKGYYIDLVIAYRAVQRMTSEQLEAINYRQLLDEVYSEFQEGGED